MAQGRQKPVKRAIAIVIRRPDAPDQVLAVERPPDDPDLPGAWGLPAGGVRPAETGEAAVVRAGREKLGVSLVEAAMVAAGRAERRDYVLDMELYEARIEDGVPRVPQAVRGVTQYVRWRWSSADAFAPAAARGSLCCRLFLESG